MPVHIQPLKKSIRPVSAHHRLRMLRIAIRGNKKFYLSDLEIKRGGKSYTVQTLRALRKNFKPKNVRLFFITGSDSLSQLDRWKDLKAISKLARFVVALRPGFPKQKFKINMRFIRIPQIDISSSVVRAGLKAGRPLRYLVDEGVLAYIKKRGLYK